MLRLWFHPRPTLGTKQGFVKASSSQWREEDHEAMFTRPVRLMIAVTAILLLLLYWKVDDRQPDSLQVPDLSQLPKAFD
jgi:hypothetical protein